MISVEAALDHLFALVAPLPAETVALADAAGRVLAEDAVARRDQPPFAASAMDGYAVAGAGVRPGATFRVIGEAAAGNGFGGGPSARDRPCASSRARRCPRAPTESSYRKMSTAATAMSPSRWPTGRAIRPDHVRPAGTDFRRRRHSMRRALLTPADHRTAGRNERARDPLVVRRPSVALIATGDELVMPGDDPGPDQIVASNIFGFKALVEGIAGGHARILPIARDNTVDSLRNFVLDLASGRRPDRDRSAAPRSAITIWSATAAEGLGMQRAASTKSRCGPESR